VAVAVASSALVFAAPAFADHGAVLPSGHHSQASAQISTGQPVLPSAHHGQTSAQLPGQPTTASQSSDSSSWNDVAAVAGAALLGSGITLGAMTLWRRRDQPVSA
jgi:hypothetical protein